MREREREIDRYRERYTERERYRERWERGAERARERESERASERGVKIHASWAHHVATSMDTSTVSCGIWAPRALELCHQ